jgi:hypothetical protein
LAGRKASKTRIRELLASRRMLRRGQGQQLSALVRQIIQPYFPGFDLEQIRIHSGIPWYVLMDAVAYTDRHRIYFKPGSYDEESIVGLALIAHEVTHCWQYHQLGAWRFRWRYIKDWWSHFLRSQSLTKAYFNVSFEREARRVEQRVYEDLNRHFPA